LGHKFLNLITALPSSNHVCLLGQPVRAIFNVCQTFLKTSRTEEDQVIIIHGVKFCLLSYFPFSHIHSQLLLLTSLLY